MAVNDLGNVKQQMGAEATMALKQALEEIAASNEVQDALIKQVQEDAEKYVYDAYTPKSSFRRYSLSNPSNIEVIPHGVEITIRIDVPLQHSYSYWTGALTAPMVTGGWEQFKQPSPRPFFSQERLQQVLDNKVAEMLKDRGFIVQG